MEVNVFGVENASSKEVLYQVQLPSMIEDFLKMESVKYNIPLESFCFQLCLNFKNKIMSYNKWKKTFSLHDENTNNQHSTSLSTSLFTDCGHNVADDGQSVVSSATPEPTPNHPEINAFKNNNNNINVNNKNTNKHNINIKNSTQDNAGDSTNTVEITANENNSNPNNNNGKPILNNIPQLNIPVDNSLQIPLLNQQLATSPNLFFMNLSPHLTMDNQNILNNNTNNNGNTNNNIGLTLFDSFSNNNSNKPCSSTDLAFGNDNNNGTKNTSFSKKGLSTDMTKLAIPSTEMNGLPFNMNNLIQQTSNNCLLDNNNNSNINNVNFSVNSNLAFSNMLNTSPFLPSPTYMLNAPVFTPRGLQTPNSSLMLPQTPNYNTNTSLNNNINNGNNTQLSSNTNCLSNVSSLFPNNNTNINPSTGIPTNISSNSKNHDYFNSIIPSICGNSNVSGLIDNVVNMHMMNNNGSTHNNGINNNTMMDSNFFNMNNNVNSMNAFNSPSYGNGYFNNINMSNLPSITTINPQILQNKMFDHNTNKIDDMCHNYARQNKNMGDIGNDSQIIEKSLNNDPLLTSSSSNRRNLNHIDNNKWLQQQAQLPLSSIGLGLGINMNMNMNMNMGMGMDENMNMNMNMGMGNNSMMPTEINSNLLPGLSATATAMLSSALMSSDLGAITATATPVVMINNLNESVVDCDKLFAICGVFGDVMRVKISYHKRDTAFVQLANHRQAKHVIFCMDRIQLYGKIIHVSLSRMTRVKLPKDSPNSLEHYEEAKYLTKDYAHSRKHRYSSKENNHNNHALLGPPSHLLHVQNLPQNTETKHLLTFLGDSEKIINIQLLNDINSNCNTQSVITMEAIVTCVNVDIACQVLIEKHSSNYNGNEIQILFASHCPVQPDVMDNSSKRSCQQQVTNSDYPSSYLFYNNKLNGNSNSNDNGNDKYLKHSNHNSNENNSCNNNGNDESDDSNINVHSTHNSHNHFDNHIDDNNLNNGNNTIQGGHNLPEDNGQLVGNNNDQMNNNGLSHAVFLDFHKQNKKQNNNEEITSNGESQQSNEIYHHHSYQSGGQRLYRRKDNQFVTENNSSFYHQQLPMSVKIFD